MDIFRAAERLMAMDDDSWHRHASPWSVWTRIPIGPLLVLSIYSRAWLGWWCLVPIGIVLGWTCLNPRSFPAPSRTDRWSARGVMGEPLFLARKETPIPSRHIRPACLLTIISAAGLPFVAYGLWGLDPFATGLGTALMFLGKMWFVDRMVWLHDEVNGPPCRDA